jgi:hypothetical protein
VSCNSRNHEYFSSRGGGTLNGDKSFVIGRFYRTMLLFESLEGLKIRLEEVSNE